VPTDLVRAITAVGTTTNVLDRIGEYLAAGATDIVVAPFGPKRTEAFESIASAAALTRRSVLGSDGMARRSVTG
jgi:alkanesulfonate monooxygenase SsuD/methylene tetrahydromethanopterin reductase-like flavin-dependent oxidoreductase (luciferase family)